MLVLTRKVQEQIYIGPTVTVTVLKTSGNTVRWELRAAGNSDPRAELIQKPTGAGARRCAAAQARHSTSCWGKGVDHARNRC